ncbi:tetratricopeptide repeat protein [Puia sp. P3]|uniref:tetratricopeptide repeat protein n=1 Tax=Puia sp. P3 TaxID=3423952 RepID=UPI003D66FDA4
MKLPLRTLCLLLGLIGCGIAGCHNNKTGEDNQQAAILSHSPYSALTDSLSADKAADKAAIYFRRGELLSRNNLHELALKDYQRSWEITPDEYTATRYASTLAILGQTSQAIRLLTDCQQRFPGNPSFPDMLGDIYQQTGRVSEALGIYDGLLKRDTSDFEAWYEKGLLLEKQKRYRRRHSGARKGLPASSPSIPMRWNSPTSTPNIATPPPFPSATGSSARTAPTNCSTPSL